MSRQFFIQWYSQILLWLRLLSWETVKAEYTNAHKALHWMFAITVVCAAVIFSINALFFQFTHDLGAHFFLAAVPGCVIVFMIGLCYRSVFPRFSLLMMSFSHVFLYIFVCGFFLVAALLTPFPIIDPILLKIDQALGFSTLQLLEFVHRHGYLLRVLQFAYASWGYLVLLTPFVLSLCANEKRLNAYFLSLMFSLMVGVLIYYCFPTIAPAGVLQSSYFTHAQHQLVERFYQSHHGQPVTAVVSGQIAFPSFHVTYSLLVCAALRPYRWLFYPVLVLSALSILATMGLGYHYLMDVIAAFVVAYVSWTRVARYNA